MDIDLNKTKLSIEILSKKLNWMSKFERTRIFQQNYTSEINLAAPNHINLTLKEEFFFITQRKKFFFIMQYLWRKL